MDWGWFEENKRQWWHWRLWCSNILVINYHVISTIWFQSGHCNLCLCKWSVVLELYVGCLHLPFSSNFLSRTNLACQRSRICTCGNMVGLWTSRCRFTGHSWRSTLLQVRSLPKRPKRPQRVWVPHHTLPCLTSPWYHSPATKVPAFPDLNWFSNALSLGTLWMFLESLVLAWGTLQPWTSNCYGWLLHWRLGRLSLSEFHFPWVHLPV